MSKARKLSIEVTHERVHDSKALPELVETIIKSGSMTRVATGKLFADGTYDINDIFSYLTDNRIWLCIKLRKNARVKLKTVHISSNLDVISQKRFAKMEG